jgi:hypothetical protein
MSGNAAEAAFNNLVVGSTLSAITFVMDYVQCDFDGTNLTAYTVLTVRAEGHTWLPTDSGWRDALCGRIGVVVRRVVRSDEQLCIDFEDNSEIAVSLRDSDYVGPEAFMLSSNNRPIVVG